MAAGILQLQVLGDRLKVIQARWMGDGDARQMWAASGHRDMAGWLAAKGKTSVGSAKQQAALATAMNAVPELADAMSSGSMSPDTAAALQPALASRHSGNVADLVDACKGATPTEARAAGSRFQALNPPVGETAADREATVRAKRFLAFGDNGDGTKSVTGLLTSFDASSVEATLAAVPGKPCAGDDRTYSQRLADALVQLCDAWNRGEVKGGRSNGTILVMVDVNDLTDSGVSPRRAPGAAYTSSGDVISLETMQRLCGDSKIARVLSDGSVPIDVGRAARLATNDQWRALVVRDGGCRFEDCPVPPEWCEIDHIIPWSPPFNGPTDLHNLVLWCIFHHHFRHRPDVRLLGDADNLAIELPDGTIVPLPPRGPTTTKPATEPHQHDLFTDATAA